MGLGPVPCVQPQRMDPGTLLQYLAQIYLLRPSPFMVCSPHPTSLGELFHSPTSSQAAPLV